MATDYAAYRDNLESGLARLGRELPGQMGGFARLHLVTTVLESAVTVEFP